MITVTTIKKEIDFYMENGSYEQKGRVNLNSAEQIERTFRQIVEWHRDAFWDELSLKLMAEIDGAVREDTYGVTTRIGESCITCLSTGCKLGLVLLYYKYFGVRCLTSFYRAGNNVWAFLSKHTEICFTMIQSEIDSYLCLEKEIDITLDGIQYTKDNWMELWHKVDEYRESFYEISHEKEMAAYDAWKKEQKDEICRTLKETISLQELYEAVGSDRSGEIDEDRLPEGYQVVNTCSYIKNQTFCRKNALWLIGRKGDSYQFFTRRSVKYPVFMEILVYDVIDGEFWTENEDEDLRYQTQFEEYLVMVLEEEEQCVVLEYPEKTMYGVLCQPDKKEITILEQGLAIEKFHEWYGKCESD